MSDGNWDYEYDRAEEIINEAELILKGKNYKFKDILTEVEIKNFNTSPRIKDAQHILEKAKDI